MSSGVVVAVIIGIGIAVQVSVLGRTASDTNPLTVSLALQRSGVAVAAVWATSRGAWADVFAVGRYWWWIPLGAGGWILVAALGFASNKIGVAATLALSVAAQLVAGLLIDSATGTHRLSATPALGAALILGGAILVVAAP
jgi:transporter family-2 protein